MELDQTDELTLKEIILKIKEYIFELIRYWWLIALFCLISVGGFLYVHYSSHLLYGATIKFVVEGQQGTGGGIANILGSIGMGKAAGGAVNPYKLLEVAQGSELFIKVMDTKMENGDIIANEILKVYQLPEEWAENNPEYEGFRFKNIGKLDDSNILKQKVLKNLHGFVLGSQADRSSALTGLTLDEEIGIYTLSSGARTEELSLALTNAFYSEIRYFFEEEVFRDQIQIAEILDAKKDSLQLIRNYKIRELAKFENRNRSVIGKNLLAERTIITMEQTAINEAYKQILVNSEMTDINRKNQKPLFVAVDRPFRPLSPVGSSLKRKIIMGLAIGIFLSFLFIVVRKMYRDIMST